MITYPVDGLLLVVVVVVGLEVGVGDVVVRVRVRVLVDQRYGGTHYDKGHIRHDNMHVRPRYGHGNHSSC